MFQEVGGLYGVSERGGVSWVQGSHSLGKKLFDFKPCNSARYTSALIYQGESHHSLRSIDPAPNPTLRID